MASGGEQSRGGIFSGSAIWLANRLGIGQLIERGNSEGSGVRRRGRMDRHGNYFDEEDEDSECFLTDEDDEKDRGDSGPRVSEVDSSDEEEANHSPLKEHPLGHSLRCRTAASRDSARFGKVKPGQSVNSFLMVTGREMNVTGKSRFSRAERCHLGSKYIPTDGPLVMEESNSRAYTGQFSADGSMFVAGFQNQQIKIYNIEKRWKVQKDIICRNLSWTVTDTALSPDQRFLVYASMSPIVHLVNVGNESGGVQSVANITDIHEGLDFSEDPRSAYVLRIWSLQFSHDGREIVAGADDNSIYVYDLESNRTTFCVKAHIDDVNAVTFADDSCNLIYSGSDDALCKVWDRRCLSRNSKAVGILEGHLEGITALDTFGDGRYFISNGKDQTLKLWDTRKMSSGIPSKRPLRIPEYQWDYRWSDYPGRNKNLKHPYDRSIMTYKGHSVLKTLIRCYVSPMHSTGQKYIYTGSEDGAVYIFDVVSGKVLKKLEYHRQPVRDVSWHPTQPTVVSSSWDGQIAKWEFLPGEVRMNPHPLRNINIDRHTLYFEDYYEDD